MQFVLSLLIALALGISALAFVLYPFYRSTPVRPEKQKNTALFPWIEERAPETANGHANGAGGAGASEGEQAARTALYEIELDYQLGNISESDYRKLRERYLQRALVALKSRYDREQELDDVIEVQLRKMKEHDDSVE
ncbi:MAG: hypothetical protein E6I97_05530 [Chloroflexi bacterium]|nr:MAG: hypothetical protein E6I97_05530 [Chloroflexota bacterium]